MKPFRTWDWWDRIWTFLAVLIIGVQVMNIIEVFTEENSYEPLTFFLAIFVILTWVGLIWNQLWLSPKRQAKWKAELDEWEAQHRKIMERFEKEAKAKK